MTEQHKFFSDINFAKHVTWLSDIWSYLLYGQTLLWLISIFYWQKNIDHVSNICNVPSKEIHWDRLCILEDKTVDPSCLYIHPVRLDGSDIDFAFCTRCHSFLPKSHAYDAAKAQSRRGQVSESHGVHRCHLGGKRAARIREEELSGGMSIPQNLEFRLVISIRCYHF